MNNLFLITYARAGRSIAYDMLHVMC